MIAFQPLGYLAARENVGHLWISEDRQSRPRVGLLLAKMVAGCFKDLRPLQCNGFYGCQRTFMDPKQLLDHKELMDPKELHIPCPHHTPRHPQDSAVCVPSLQSLLLRSIQRSLNPNPEGPQKPLGVQFL